MTTDNVQMAYLRIRVLERVKERQHVRIIWLFIGKRFCDK